jgi:hypothetical protein
VAALPQQVTPTAWDNAVLAAQRLRAVNAHPGLMRMPGTAVGFEWGRVSPLPEQDVNLGPRVTRKSSAFRESERNDMILLDRPPG